MKPLMYCPNPECRHALNLHAEVQVVEDLHDPVDPKEGDVGICGFCYHLHVFHVNPPSLSPVTEADWGKLDPEFREFLTDMVETIRYMDMENPGWKEVQA